MTGTLDGSRTIPGPIPGPPPGPSPEDLEAGRMPLFDHLVELRRRLIYCIVAFFACWLGCYIYSEQIYNFLVAPLAQELAGKPGHHLIYTALTEAFVTRIKVSAWAALFISFPVIATQVWLFVAPGLYRHERGAFWPYLIATPVLFVGGGALVYYVIMPTAWHFFLSFESGGGPGGLPIEATPKVSDYLSLVMSFIFAFGFAFQLPVGLTLLARVGIIGSAFLVRYRRYAILINVVMAAVLTPPDAISMVSLAVPLWILYEISIWSCRLVERGRNRRAAAQA